jgi:hypothetical protein
MMGFIKVKVQSHHLLSNGYNPQPQQIMLLEKKPDKSIFDSKIDAITHRIQEDFSDEEIGNFPGRTRRTRQINRNKFYGGIVIGFVVFVWCILEVAIDT